MQSERSWGPVHNGLNSQVRTSGFILGEFTRKNRYGEQTQWQSQRIGFSCAWVLCFSTLNRMFHEGLLSWHLPALSSCREGLGVGGREKKVFFCLLLSSVQETYGPGNFLLQGSSPPADWSPLGPSSTELRGEIAIAPGLTMLNRICLPLMKSWQTAKMEKYKHT